MNADDASALVGAVLERRWQLIRSLGAGGLGLVYEAADLGGGPPVAVKLLRPEFHADDAVVERFFQEAAAAGKVQHPGVVRMLGVSRAEDGTPYLVMELCEGEPLTALMNRGRLPLEHAIAIVGQLLIALGAAHAAGVIHRDLKPDNVFLVASAEGPRVKVLDFGLARVIDAAGGAARRTKTGMLLGTPGYMSPEQVVGNKSIDLRADLWAVAILLYEMLTGSHAFEGADDFMRLTAVLHGKPIPIAQVAPHYAHFAPFFERALDVSPAGRFQSAEEMAAAALAVARSGHLPETLRSPGSAARHESWAPPPSLPSPSAAQAIFGGADTALSPGLQSTSPMAIQAPSPVPWRMRVWVAVLIAAGAALLGFIAGWFAS